MCYALVCDSSNIKTNEHIGTISESSDVLLATYPDKPRDILWEDKKILILACNAAPN